MCAMPLLEGRPDSAPISSVAVCSCFFNDTATTEIYTLSLHDALPICATGEVGSRGPPVRRALVFTALLLAGVALLGAIALGLAGCGKLTGKLTGVTHGNTPPHTVLFVNGAVDTVNHVVHLFWFGTDPDGNIAGFEWQLLNPADTTDKSWHFTTKSDSVFTVFTPRGYTAPLFSVRAIHTAAARDPPPPVQTFEFSNLPPTVTLVQKPLPTDTTFASVSVTWTANDPDGEDRKSKRLNS